MRRARRGREERPKRMLLRRLRRRLRLFIVFHLFWAARGGDGRFSGESRAIRKLDQL